MTLQPPEPRLPALSPPDQGTSRFATAAASEATLDWSSGSGWSRRAWLTHQAVVLGLASPVLRDLWGRRRVPAGMRVAGPTATLVTARLATQAALADPSTREALAQQAVEAAHAAGATYADTRLTRSVRHFYRFTDRPNQLVQDVELLGLGVRALVDGAWGFSASPRWTAAEATRLAQAAVAQAKVNGRAAPGTRELGPAPAVTGRWATPIRIDPFTITLEEKSDTLSYWLDQADRVQLSIDQLRSWLLFARQEQTLATSAGTLVSQTLYESGGVILAGPKSGVDGQIFPITGIEMAGKGWELFVDAQVPEQLRRLPAQIEARAAELARAHAKPATVGRYTLVCDGVTMAHLVEQTFGITTQLDRALGYEANAGGTSYLDDPLGMLGTLPVAAPMVTITANRSAPAQLATVKWDAEGMVPEETTLVKHGVLVDYQTTREQAAWLAPYYQKAGKPVRSHGYAAAEDALAVTLQHMPNLAMAPGADGVGLADLISTVKDGILVTTPTPVGRDFVQVDQQGRNGFFAGNMRQIKNGRLGPFLGGQGGILFNTPDFWKRVVAVGGPATQGEYASTAMNDMSNVEAKLVGDRTCKGQPVQLTSHSVRAPAAVITEQALINQARQA